VKEHVIFAAFADEQMFGLRRFTAADGAPGDAAVRQ
jgi:hypothetical protein